MAKKKLAPLEPGDPRHGTTNGYTNRDCRCRACRDAHTIATREMRWSRYLRLLADPSLAEHGKASTYGNWGCRCRPCTDAHTKLTVDRRNAHRGAGGAVSSTQPLRFKEYPTGETGN